MERNAMEIIQLHVHMNMKNVIILQQMNKY